VHHDELDDHDYGHDDDHGAHVNVDHDGDDDQNHDDGHDDHGVHVSGYAAYHYADVNVNA